MAHEAEGTAWKGPETQSDWLGASQGAVQW